MKRVTVIASLLIGVIIPGISAAQIVNQLPDTSAFAFADQEFGDSPGFSSFLVDDVTLASNSGFGYAIDSVSAVFRANTGSLAGITTANLTIFQNDGVLDTETIPVQQVAVTVTSIADQVNGPNFKVTASNLGISLADGNYWFGLTPVADSTVVRAAHWVSATTNGQEAHWINPGGSFTLGTEWNPSSVFNEGSFDLSLVVEGTEKVPEPTSALLLSAGLIGLISRRRR